MKRETSKKAFIEVVSKIPDSQVLVYSHTFEFGPGTARELSMKAPVWSRSDFHKRLSELRKLGYVKECGTKKCSVTGRTAIVWDCTSKAPKKK